MNRATPWTTLIGRPMALSAIAAMPLCAAAQNSSTIYGLVDMSFGASRTGSGSLLPDGAVRGPDNIGLKRVDSGIGAGSRLGFRGAEDLGSGLRANYVLEMGIAADTGGLTQGGLAFGRQIYVGVGGTDWSVSLGRQYSPMNNAVATSEVGIGGYWGNVTNEAVGVYESIGGAPGSGAFATNGRVDNSVLLTVSHGSLTGNFLVGAGNENDRGTGRSINAGLTYANGPLKANVVLARMRQNVEQIVPSESPEWMSQRLVGGSYALDWATLYAGAFEFRGPRNKANLAAVATLGAPGASPQAFSWDKNRILWVGARIPMGVQAILLQAARMTYSYASGRDGASTILAVAYEYSLSKRTLLYASYGQVENNGRARTPLYGAIPAVGPNGFGASPKALSVGTRVSF